MKNKNFIYILFALMNSLPIATALSQTFVPAVPDSATTIVYIMRDPAMLGAVAAWPISCFNRTQHEGEITKSVLNHQPVLATIRQKQYCQLNLIADMDYIINVMSGGHYILYNGQGGSVALLIIQGVTSNMFCYSREIVSMSNSESDLNFNADLQKEGKKLTGNIELCAEPLSKLSEYELAKMKK